MKDIIEELKWRGLIHQTTDIETLQKLLNSKSVAFYFGCDPSSDSLQIGNFLGLITARRFQLCGHKPILLAGGATGMIGDPGGKKEERNLIDLKTLRYNVEQITKQMGLIFDFKHPICRAEVVNNYDWFKKINFLDFMRDTGKHFTVNYLLDRDWIKSRLESGISFAEFSYSLIQAFDYLTLNKKFNCELQIGGSDQWGNIVSGVDLIKTKTGKEVHALSIPLLLKSDGTKFGKSENGCIYLDRKRTSPYQMYQYFINTDDKDIIKFLKQFTFLNQEEIRIYEKQVLEEPEKRESQKTLAKFMVELIHGKKDVINCEKISNALFYGDFKKLTKIELEDGLNDVPSFEIKDTKEINLIDLLILGNISPSKRQAKEDIENKAISINGEVKSDVDFKLTKSNTLFNKYIIIRRGKKNYFLCKWN